MAKTPHQHAAEKRALNATITSLDNELSRAHAKASRVPDLEEQVADLIEKLEDVTADRERAQASVRDLRKIADESTKLANQLERDLATAKIALHSMEVRAYRAEAIASSLQDRLYPPRPVLPWEQPEMTTTNY